MYFWNLLLTNILLILTSLVTVTESRKYYIKEGEIPSYLYHKFDHVKEEIFPDFITITAAFSVVTGTLWYSIDRNMNQLIVTMRNDLYHGTGLGLQVELNTQLIIVSLPKLCMDNGSPFDERIVLTLRILVSRDNITLMCNSGIIYKFVNERRDKFNDDYPIMYSPSQPRTSSGNEAHLWLVNHPIMGQLYPNRYQMHGCIFNVYYNNLLINFANTSSNVGDTCKVVCQDSMCNGGECLMIYSEQASCNCTKAFRNGKLCNDDIAPMNFRTSDQSFVYKTFKLSWKSEANVLLELINPDIRILIGRNNSILFFQYNFMDNKKDQMQVNLSTQYIPGRESICIVYFYEDMINIRTYNNYTWTDIWTPSIYDIRMAKINTMVFTSGQGTMDFVHEISRYSPWRHVDFIKPIPIRAEPSSKELIMKVTIPIFICILIAVAIALVIILKMRRRKTGLKKIKDRKYIKKCKSDIGWNIVARNRLNSMKMWRKFIDKKKGPESLSYMNLKKIHRLIRDSLSDIHDYSSEFVVLFIHARLIVIPSLNLQTKNDYRLSIKYLQTMFNDNRDDYRLYQHKYLAECMMDFLGESNNEKLEIIEINSFVTTIMNFVAYYTMINRYKFDRDLTFLESYLSDNSSVAVLPAVILGQNQYKPKYLDIIKEYLTSNTESEISTNSMAIYYALMRYVSTNKYKNYMFTDVDYRIIKTIFEADFKSERKLNVKEFIGGYIINAFNIVWSPKISGSMGEVLQDEHYKVSMNCVSLLLSQDMHHDNTQIILSSLMDQLQRNISIGFPYTRMVEVFSYHLCGYRIFGSLISYVNCNLLSTDNISEEIRLSSSIIICHNIEHAIKMHQYHDLITGIPAHISAIIETGDSANYLGFTHDDLINAKKEIEAGL